MGNATSVQSAFTGGRWSKYAQGRFDKPEYKTALGECLNAYPMEVGAWTRRGGTQYAGPTLAGQSVNREFAFQEQTPYTCEFGVGTLSFRVGKTRVVDGTFNVAGISAGNPAVAQTAVGHNFQTGDTGFFQSLGTGVPVLQNRTFTVTVLDATHLELFDSQTGAGIDGSALGPAFAGGAISRIMHFNTPYQAADLQNIRLVQTDTVAYLFCKGFIPYVLIVAQPPTATTFATFLIEPVQNIGASPYGFQDGPYLDPVLPGPYLTPNVSGAGQAPVALIASSGTPFANAGVGQLIRLFSQPPQWVGHTSDYFANDPVTVFNDIGGDPANATYWQALQDVTHSASNLSPQNDPTNWAQNPALAGWAWGVITGVISPTEVIAVLFSVNSLGYASAPVYLWQLGVFSDASNSQPTCGTYHEGRLWVSGAVPNRIDSSMSDNILVANLSTVTTFSPTTANNTVTDANGCSYIFNAPDVNPIFWMIPDLLGIVCGTQAGEWLIQATASNNPLTPTDMQAHRMTRVGCANIEPRRCELTIVFVQKYLRKLQEYFADVFSGKFSSPNLSEMAKDLTTNNLVEIAYQQDLSPIVWGRTGAGQLIGASYKRESLFSSQGPKYIGWHRHTLGSGYSVVSLCEGPSVGGNLDTLTLITNDPATGAYYVELLTDEFDEDSTLFDAVYVDQATQPTSYFTTPGSGANPNGTITFNGLWHFNGKTVSVWAAGLDCGDYLVTLGSLTVPFGDGVLQGIAPLFTATFWAAHPIAWVGYNFVSDGQLLPPVDPREAGTQAGLAVAKVQRTQQFGAKLTNCGAGGSLGGVKFGGDFTKLHPASFRTPGGRYALPATSLFDGIYWNVLDDDYTLGTAACWRIDRPYPFTMTAIGSFLHTQDR